jgi:hypothetical protein
VGLSGDVATSWRLCGSSRPELCALYHNEQAFGFRL